jgi:hypothetical protein
VFKDLIDQWKFFTLPQRVPKHVEVQLKCLGVGILRESPRRLSSVIALGLSPLYT